MPVKPQRVGLISESCVFGSMVISRAIGMSIGTFRGALASTSVHSWEDLFWLQPNLWRKEMFAPGVHKRDELKKLALAKAKELYPNLHLTNITSDAAEALCMMQYVLHHPEVINGKTKAKAATAEPVTPPKPKPGRPESGP
jgi:hypothetical protein